MSVGTKLLQAAAGNAGEAVYVDDLFSTFLYKGNGSTQSIVNGLDLSGEGGMVWLKGRDVAEYPAIYDTVRGQSKVLYSALNSAQASNSDLSSFNSNGFSLSYTYGQTNTNNKDYVAWSFRKQEKFFDVVTYTGDGTDNRAIAHNLGSVPGMILLKVTSHADNWIVYHRSLGYTKLLRLNMTNSAWTQDRWGDQNPTSTHFYVDNNAECNQSGYTYVAYLFGHNEAEYGQDSDEAIIKCGSYTGNDGTQDIDVGFEPQWVLIKNIDNTANWVIVDMMRGFIVDNSADSTSLQPNTSNTESSSTAGRIGPRPNGFGFINESGNDLNSVGSGYDYMYVAIRRPHKPASEFAATDLFAVDEADNSDSKEPKWRTTFPVDFAIDNWATQNGSDKHVSSRLIQGKYLRANGTNAESSESSYQFDYMNGFYADSSATSGMYAWMFRRAKGFFDVVAYTGDGTSTSFSHNLGATPELKIIKIRSDAFGWLVGGSAVTGGTRDYQLYLDTNAARANTNYWGAVDSASAFSVVASNFLSNANGQTYVAYLFATVAGISKVGSYTGTGSDVNVDCGFSAGARFILIKYYTNPGDWYLFDSVRGIVAGNDPYTLLNTTATQVTNTDYIDPLSSGFTVTSSAPSGMNEDGGQYIFLAIA